MNMFINPKLLHLIDVFFITFNGQNVFCQVTDVNKKLVFLNDYYDAQKIILNSKNSLGLTLAEFIVKKNHVYYDKYIDDIEAIYDSVLETGQPKSFLVYAKDLSNNEYVRMANIFPLFSNDNVLLGTYTISWFTNPFSFLTNFQNGLLSNNQKAKMPDIPHLSNREHQILFLLIHNFSQYEIANYLQISRGTVQKTINEKLMAKFGINMHDSALLISKAIKLNLHVYFPPSLLGNRLIDLEQEESIIRAIARSINTK